MKKFLGNINILIGMLLALSIINLFELGDKHEVFNIITVVISIIILINSVIIIKNIKKEKKC